MPDLTCEPCCGAQHIFVRRGQAILWRRGWTVTAFRLCYDCWPVTRWEVWA